MSDGGKGSSPRPFSVDKKTFDDNWDRIFKKKEEQNCGIAQQEERQTHDLEVGGSSPPPASK